MMAISEPTSEEDLASLLPADPEAFLRFLFEDYRKQLAACIGKRGMGLLQACDIKDALQETFIAVWDKIREPEFDASHPVLPMVFTIARNKAIDARRHKVRLAKIGTNQTDITDLIIFDLAGSDLAIDYRCASEEEKWLLDNLLLDIVADLPERQKLAVNAFFEGYEEIRAKNKYAVVADVMTRMSGQSVDVVAAKSALRAGLQKVRSELIRRGIGFVKERDV